MKYQQLKFSDIKEVDLKIKSPYLILHTPLFNISEILPLLLIIASIRLLFEDGNVYLFLSAFLFGVSLYQLWIIFEPIKIIKINLVDHYFILIDRNPIKSIFKTQKKIQFTSIKKLTISDVYDFTTRDRRFIVFGHLEDLSKTSFTQTSKKETAQSVITFLYRLKEIKAN